MNWKKWGIVIVILALLWGVEQYPDGKLHLIFCDVGQGDAALVVLGSFQALVDTGQDKEKILNCLAQHIPFWDKQIELVFISHSDFDHAGELSEIEKRYKLKKIIDKPSANDVIRYGSLQFDILSAVEAKEDGQVLAMKSDNDLSVVMEMRYRGFSALFAGDIGESMELALVASGVLEKVDVLKVPHHGSKFSSTISFLERLRPNVAVISVGEKNSYGHPNSDTLRRFDIVGAKVLRTDKNGEIELVVEGGKVAIYRKK